MVLDVDHLHFLFKSFCKIISRENCSEVVESGSAPLAYIKSSSLFLIM